MSVSALTPALVLRSDVRPGDAALVAKLAEATGYFSAAEVVIAEELVRERLTRGLESGYEFLFAEDTDCTVGYACFGPVAGTCWSYDLYWVVVVPSHQRRGIGRALVAGVEAVVLGRGGGRIYVETSSRPQYESTRSFYWSAGYRPQALVAEFYGPGDGKLIYCKVLAAGSP